MKVSRWIALAGVAALHCGRDDVGGARRRFVVEGTEGVVHGGARERHRRSSPTTGFNRNQLKGLNKAEGKARRHRDSRGLALDERLRAELQRRRSARARSSSSRQASCSRRPRRPTRRSSRRSSSRSPTTRCTRAPFADKKGNVLPAYKNVEGITYAANESGCLVGVLAAKMAQKMGGNTIGAVGGLKIPPVDIWIAGYRYCANKAVPGDEDDRSVLERLRRRLTSARPSPRTRSGRARRCSSRSPAAAGSAR